jgi:hypothetical protein
MGIPWLLHPSYGPDIAPYDFWLFGYLKLKFEGMFFDTPAALLAEVEEILGYMNITEAFERYDERRSEARKKSRSANMFCILTMSMRI